MIKITCSKCGKSLEPHRKQKYRYCTRCHAEYMREYRPKYSELSPEAKKKANARSILRMAIKRGKIIKDLCKICGSTNVEAHHPDYNHPLNVEWFCRKHHLEHHKNLVTA